MLEVGQESLSEQARGSQLKEESVIKETEEDGDGGIRKISARNSNCDKVTEIS